MAAKCRAYPFAASLAASSANAAGNSSAVSSIHTPEGVSWLWRGCPKDKEDEEDEEEDEEEEDDDEDEEEA